ncbi:MAG: FAD-dependent oxidoreductase [Anaerolineaceae bacterium]|nr:FAD-dependent oxidoreductase [Anaerolineaceae bacterium]
MVATTEQAVVVGGGLLGQDMTEALSAVGVKVTLLVREDRVGLGQFDPASSRLLADELRGLGADLRLETEVARIEGDSGRVSKVVTSTGENISCQLVFVAIGAVPNTAWLQPAGLEVNRGIVVDGRLATNLPDVFAAGSCAEIHTAGRQMIQPSWANALAMGQVVAGNMLGRPEQYLKPSAYTTKVGRTKFTLFGAPAPACPQARYVEFCGPDGSRGALLAEGGVVRGGVLVGRHKKAGAIRDLQLRDEPLPGLAEMSGRQPMSVSEFVAQALAPE